MDFESVHPGRILDREIKARDMTANALAVAIRVPASRIDQILKGKRAISPETALRLGRYLGTGPEIWLNMQTGYDLWKAEREFGRKIEKEVKAA
jgi:antitoxin HigA-1